MEKIPVRHLAPSPKESTIREAFRIVPIGSLLAGNDMIQPLHRHSFYYLLVLEKGNGTHRIDFQEYPITDHFVFFIRPGQVHELLLHKDSTGYLVEFTHEFYSPSEPAISQLFRKVSSQNYCALDTDRFASVLTLMALLFQEYTRQQERYQEVVRSTLTILFIELLRQSNNAQQPVNEQTVYLQERLEELLALIEQHCITRKQVRFYTEQLHLTSYQLNAITKNTLGKTCQEVINDAVILEAKRQLRSTTNQINQIAFHLGYEDVSYFIRFFKKHTGHSPVTFRHNFT